MVPGRPPRTGIAALAAAMLCFVVAAPAIQAASSVTIHAGSGTNVVHGTAGNDSLFGDGGSHTLIGGAGNDRLVGGPAYAVLEGGTGNDTIDARHSTPATGQAFANWSSAAGARGAAPTRPDVVSCGTGIDTVYADANTIVAADCEHVLRTAA